MRPLKNGLDYFPLDVNTDDKFELVEAKHGITGFAVVIKLFQKIYAEGYYYKWDENAQLLFSKRINVDINQVNEIIADTLRWQIFDEAKYKKYQILTSNGIQKRYIEATARRKEISVFKEYWINGSINLENDNIIFINVDNSTQRKGKESKIKESKVIQPEILFEIFNEENKYLPGALAFTDKRKEKCRTRIKKFSDDLDKFVDSFRRAVQKAQLTPFLKGENDRGWKASFDWLIENDENFLKVLEGKYDGKDR